VTNVAKFLGREWSSAELSILRAHAATHTAVQISALMDGSRTPKAVFQMARRVSVRLRKFGENSSSHKHSDATVRRAFDLCCQGLKYREIAIELDVPAGTIGDCLSGYYRYAAVAP